MADSKKFFNSAMTIFCFVNKQKRSFLTFRAFSNLTICAYSEEKKCLKEKVVRYCTEKLKCSL